MTKNKIIHDAILHFSLENSFTSSEVYPCAEKGGNSVRTYVSKSDGASETAPLPFYGAPPTGDVAVLRYDTLQDDKGYNFA